MPQAAKPRRNRSVAPRISFASSSACSRANTSRSGGYTLSYTRCSATASAASASPPICAPSPRPPPSRGGVWPALSSARASANASHAPPARRSMRSPCLSSSSASCHRASAAPSGWSVQPRSRAPSPSSAERRAAASLHRTASRTARCSSSAAPVEVMGTRCKVWPHRTTSCSPHSCMQLAPCARTGKGIRLGGSRACPPRAEAESVWPSVSWGGSRCIASVVRKKRPNRPPATSRGGKGSSSGTDMRAAGWSSVTTTACPAVARLAGQRRCASAAEGTMGTTCSCFSSALRTMRASGHSAGTPAPSDGSAHESSVSPVSAESTRHTRGVTATRRSFVRWAANVRCSSSRDQRSAGGVARSYFHRSERPAQTHSPASGASASQWKRVARDGCKCATGCSELTAWALTCPAQRRSSSSPWGSAWS
mmetsp:Transcript_14355/g.34122  ORF Transcript_14355/g.34122 Transcript_14355/m.34122 type:complete len:424 (-) Transcript_14355:264-1535(-)